MTNTVDLLTQTGLISDVVTKWADVPLSAAVRHFIDGITMGDVLRELAA